MSKVPEIKIVVATHKPYWMPDDPAYIPVQVGSIDKAHIDGFQPDDQGDNISEKNPFYSELTALFWAWKNIDAEYIGLTHYRRQFRGNGEKGVATSEDLLKKLSASPVLLPKKRFYGIETVESHYSHTFSQSHIEAARKAIQLVSPEFLSYFNAHMAERKTHVWNMMVMRQDILDMWCNWLFSTLETVEHFIDFSQMTDFEKRVIGRLSELFIDPWLAWQMQGYAELPIVSLEGEPWLKKGRAFLSAKFFGKKYNESF